MPRICMMTTRNLNFRMNGKPGNNGSRSSSNNKMLSTIKLCRLTHKQPFKMNKLDWKRVWCGLHVVQHSAFGILLSCCLSTSDSMSHSLLFENVSHSGLSSSASAIHLWCVLFCYLCAHIIRNFWFFPCDIYNFFSLSFAHSNAVLFSSFGFDLPVSSFIRSVR